MSALVEQRTRCNEGPDPAILDGTPIDWAGAESSADEASRPVLAELRVLAALQVDSHRAA
jgi:hypothetical protein